MNKRRGGTKDLLGGVTRSDMVREGSRKNFMMAIWGQDKRALTMKFLTTWEVLGVEGRLDHFRSVYSREPSK